MSKTYHKPLGDVIFSGQPATAEKRMGFFQTVKGFPGSFSEVIGERTDPAS